MSGPEAAAGFGVSGSEAGPGFGASGSKAGLTYLLL